MASLTPRESEVFGLMVRGKRNKQIAYDISTSERTVKAHRHCVMEKLGAKSLAEAVSIAERMGLLDISPKPCAARRMLFPLGQYTTSFVSPIQCR